ncbi:serine carboxypeptidase 24 isoform X2 [Malania oleifera]|uniref:serine carboxypeptidase 24 isoform X2 n=1 Tax=Malania oleifera TaxID=397392 RepID=UPI0025ADD7C0|nr:serine carboxypeptidase 24 isoform X2 [Malania oleifera]
MIMLLWVDRVVQGYVRRMAGMRSLLLLYALSIITIISASCSVASALPKQQVLDRISALPGQPPVKFSQFSGYVTVDEQQGRSLFYWLTESPSNPQKKPLLLWLNGGPGCSSVAYGASEEIGPFRIKRGGLSLYLNKHSWNKAEDALIFLRRWMSRFPQYKHRQFYIAGESYAGHYIPQLAKKIYDYNKPFSHPIINLRGFLVGNGVTDNYYDSIGTVTYWWSHSIISDTTYHRILSYCNFSADLPSRQCNHILNYAMNREFGDIDQYSIYTPSCATTTVNIINNNYPTLRRFMELKKKKKKKYLSSSSSNGGEVLFRGGYDPCTQNYAEKYFNREEVQRAMHANSSGIIPYRWTPCSDVLTKNWKDSQDSMLPTYSYLIAAGLRIWLFSGDTDSVVPVTATRLSLSHLNLTIKTPWYPWYSGPQEVGGWTEEYQGLTFATVRGAGHEVPLFQPKRAFILLRSFLSGKHLPPAPSPS